MVYSDTSGLQGIIQDITFFLGVDLNNYKIEDRTRNVNGRFGMVWEMIFESYGGWRWQDDNANANPYGDQDIVSGTGTGALPSGALTVRGVQLKDSSGVYHPITCITEEEYLERGGDAVWNGVTGFPSFMLVYEDTWKLLPTPNYTQTQSLRVYFDRDISSFATTDTTKVPGFASPFHRMLSIGAALDYAIARNLTNKQVSLQQLWNDYEQRLRSFYSKRYLARFPARINPGEDLMVDFS